MLSPGDIVMMTAAIRDLHAAHPGAYVTDTRTACEPLFAHNPYITPLVESEAEILDLHYPLIHKSNDQPWHFIHGYRMNLEDQLGVKIPAGPFRGDLHLSIDERTWMSQVEETCGPGQRFWIIVSGGKKDFTIKWWDHARYQAIVDHFKGRILFVQVGEASHAHPALDGVLDLRGKTDLRQLVRLVYHAEGVVCGVTSLMHLAAAVPMKPGAWKNRPCVVIAGGREPVNWEAYPHHRYLHSALSLPCCDLGGCWRSRVQRLGDMELIDGGMKPSPHDAPEKLCKLPVEIRPEVFLPRCMDLITAADAIRAVESYFVGGMFHYLS